MRLKDEDAVIKRIVEVQGENIAPGAVPLYSIWKTILAQVPTIDAEPVIHAAWIFDPEAERGSDFSKYPGYVCSNCGHIKFLVEGNYYCSKCGARMDGGEE